jgi:hypothetical protein
MNRLQRPSNLVKRNPHPGASMTDFPILDIATEVQPAAVELHFVVDAELACVGGGGGLMDY